MRKFSKINESIEDKDPIDPSEDVKEFKEKFSKSYEAWQDSNSPISRMFREIESSHPTMTDEYETYRVDRLLWADAKTGSVVGYFRAVSKNHARIRASIFKNNKEILLTGYYSAYMGANIGEEIKTIEDNIKKLQKELDELKNPI
jgi:hypothetical protein